MMDYTFLDDAPDAFYVLDRQWRFVYINRRAEQLWGRTRDDLIGKVVWNVFPQAVGSQAYEEHQRAVRDGHPITFETLSPVLNRWIQCTISPYQTGLAVYFHDITAQKEAEHRSQLLQDIIEALSTALTLETVARVIVGKVREGLGGHTGSVNLLTDDGQSVRILRTADVAEEVFQQLKLAPVDDASRPDTDVLRTGQAVWIHNRDEYYARYPRLARALQAKTGTEALAVLPLLVSGHIIGVIFIGFPTPQSFGEEVQAFLTTVAHYCAQAVERVRLLESEQRAREQAERQSERLKRLHDVAAAISHALTFNDIVRVVVDEGFALLGAFRGAVGILSEDGAGLKVIGTYRLPSDISQQFAYLPLDAATPMTAAARTRQMVVFQSFEEYQQMFPELAAQIAATREVQSAIALPLLVQDRLIGSIGISFAQPQVFTQGDIEFSQILAQHIAEGLERVRLYELEAEARVARELAATNARLEAEIAARKLLEADLRANLEREKELNELKSRFISVVSHEFRTPMAVILSSSDLLRRYYDRMSDDQRAEHWERIKAHVNHLTRLLETVLGVGRTQVVGLEYHAAVVDLEALCRELVIEMQFIAQTHEIVFTSEGQCGQVVADRQLIGLMISNLLSNAMKYSPGAEQVHLRLTCASQEVVIQVQDAGIGIPEADLPYLFRPYFRAANAREISGTGIGLTLVREIVELHRGTITVETGAGTGTTVTVQLPAG
ncbi:MAG: GAF domain-containing protein [Chloroflexi bacterium]|nr:GAF domain-containing protein [Chloroflexota bacterium]